MTKQKQVSVSQGKMGKLKSAGEELGLLHEEILKLGKESSNRHEEFVKKIRVRYHRIEGHTPEAFEYEFRAEQMAQEKTKVLIRLSQDAVLTMNNACNLSGSDEIISIQLDQIFEKGEDIRNSLNKTIRTIMSQLGDLTSFYQTCIFNQPIHPLIPVLMQATVFLDDQHRALLTEIKEQLKKLKISLEKIKNNPL
jgi:hypothetical protein